MRNRRRNFTLVELLVVIGIIAILAGMLMAGIMYAPAKAQKAKAQAEITTLVNAIKQFESAYGVLPIPSGVSGDNIVLDGKDYRKMIGILQDAVKELQDLGNDDNNPWKGESDSNKDKDLKKNKRHSKFLDIQGNDPGQFTDPWGNDYYVVLDGDYNGKIVTDKIDGVNASSNTYRFSVIAWSKGNDRKSSSSSKTDKTNEDNVYSFPTTWSSSTGHNISK